MGRRKTGANLFRIYKVNEDWLYAKEGQAALVPIPKHVTHTLRFMMLHKKEWLEIAKWPNTVRLIEKAINGDD